MKENIQRETVSISQEELQHANTEFLWRHEHEWKNGQHFQHLLKCG